MLVYLKDLVFLANLLRQVRMSGFNVLSKVQAHVYALCAFSRHNSEHGLELHGLSI